MSVSTVHESQTFTADFLFVWLLPPSEGASAFFVIVSLTYLVGLGGFSHIIAGSVEALYLVTSGLMSWGSFFGRFMVPTLIGNIIGGTALVAVLNHAQVIAGGGRRQQ